ncbi:hypothetical protein AB0M35_02665 [Micromonospora sp. NPDC051196]|uniref:hypothetical protein n=1 Tax=Micromonospora sp. NPDC051196 TaxID=3155281 RepID=UPI00341A7027
MTGQDDLADLADLGLAVERLSASTSRVDGGGYLDGWSLRRLRALAAHLELRGVGGLRKADLVDRIVDHTIGYRLDSSALRQR